MFIFFISISQSHEVCTAEIPPYRCSRLTFKMPLEDPHPRDWQPCVIPSPWEWKGSQNLFLINRIWKSDEMSLPWLSYQSLWLLSHSYSLLAPWTVHLEEINSHVEDEAQIGENWGSCWLTAYKALYPRLQGPESCQQLCEWNGEKILSHLRLQMRPQNFVPFVRDSKAEDTICASIPDLQKMP